MAIASIMTTTVSCTLLRAMTLKVQGKGSSTSLSSYALSCPGSSATPSPSPASPRRTTPDLGPLAPPLLVLPFIIARAPRAEARQPAASTCSSLKSDISSLPGAFKRNAPPGTQR